MKRHFFAALLLFILAGCAIDDTYQAIRTEEKQITIKAIREDDAPETRTMRDEDGKVYWCKGDQISLFYGSGTNGGSVFTSTQEEDLVKVTNFVGTITAITGGGEVSVNDTYFWGLYPYNENATCDGTSITTTLSSHQVSYPGSYANGTNISVGRSQGLIMGFYNACGGFRFSLNKEGVKKVTFRGRNGEDLAGELRVSFVNGKVKTEILEGESEVVLEAPSGEYFEPGELYYIVLAPAVLSSGFTVTAETFTEEATFTYDTSVTIEASNFKSKKLMDAGLTWTQKTVSTDNIVFADEAVKAVCVAEWDTNDDGELSYKEAAMVESFSIGLPSTATSFDEFQYFTKVTAIEQSAFANLHHLTSIVIPENVTSIGNKAFYFSGLTSITIPETVTSIGESAFYACPLLSVTIPENVTSVGPYAFWGSGLGTTVYWNIPSIEWKLSTNLHRVAMNVHFYVDGVEIKEIVLPDSMTSIGKSFFGGWSGLTSVTIPPSVTSIGSFAFDGCSDLTSVIIPASVTSIGDQAFHGCSSLTSVVIPENVTNLGLGVFLGCPNLTSLYFLAQTPPTIVDHLSPVLIDDSNHCTIYVPASSVSAYRSAWSSYPFAKNISAIPSTSVIDLSLDRSFLSLEVGVSETIHVTILPEYATDNTISWSSSDVTVVTVSSTGIVTGVSEGTATISAQCGDIIATCTVDVFEAILEDFNPNTYLIYRANETGGWNGDDYMTSVSYMPGISGTKVEMKFQLAGPGPISSGNIAHDDYDYMDVTESALIWNVNDSGSYSFTIENATSLLLIKFNGANHSLSINSNSFYCGESNMNLPRLFVSYGHESDGGVWDVYSGVPDGSKLYYVKAWDADNTLNYAGFATTAFNPDTNKSEYCWCSYYPKTGEVSYTFANDAVNQGGFDGYTYTN